ncbi:carboxynorspermidine decarboxylase [Aliidiomarina taiwanensis]|uniref:Carboxynorspermidine/carboxyspermidine decarboxylase n=1 Tax=Aliidiomarina taiwanensis TaxID=946228 RepID=A0A432X018_9GAMM|nr:carboxynorspermidine decarboxylase [Aliidiomarina taiwanensis]RUO39379.1 carboxynorspermidine decarboxylase [Aliidiomarina taiwanensis]
MSQNSPFLSADIPSPCYVLDEAKLRRNLELMKHVQEQSGAEIILALKGFSMWSSFPLVKQYLAGCTASSIWEAELAADTFGGEVHAYSPAYKASEMPRLLELCQHISFNSLSQFERFKEQAKAAGVSMGIRINPEQQEADTELYDPSAPGSRLGIRAVDLQGADLSDIEGFHVHNLCECDSFSLERTLQAVEDKFGQYLHQLKWINLGGGHLMTRAGYDVDHLIAQLKRLRETYDLEVILEPGSAVAWQTGPLVCEVVDIVNNEGNILIVDISATAHMPDVLEMPYRPALTFKGEQGGTAGEKPYAYRIGGNSCLAGDVLPEYTFHQEIQIGDRLLFEDMMHYTMVKTSFFNGVEHPSIGILREDNSFDLVRTFNYQDFKSRLS